MNVRLPVFIIYWLSGAYKISQVVINQLLSYPSYGDEEYNNNHKFPLYQNYGQKFYQPLNSLNQIVFESPRSALLEVTV